MPNSATMVALKALNLASLVWCSGLSAQQEKPKFRVIAFATAQQDQAHISFVREAERWFPEMAAKYHFGYDTTSNWHNLNADFLADYQVVVFLDTRPEDPSGVHGAWRRLDGLPFCRFCVDTLSRAGKLELVSQCVSRLGIIRD